MLTPEGRRVAEAAERVAAEITTETLAPLAPEDRETVVRLLWTLGGGQDNGNSGGGAPG